MTLYAPFRLLFALAAALLIASVIASSSAHAMLLGDAVTQSALGTPLRVVIPVRPAAGESLDAACFRLVPTTAGTGAPIVTGRVSLERAAATPRLIVSTPNAISEPAVQFAVQVGCDGTIRRNYVVLLDPPAVNGGTATLRPSPAREPGQERLQAALSATRRNAIGSPRGEPRAAPRAVASASRAVASASSAPPAMLTPVRREATASASLAPAAFGPAATAIERRTEAAPRPRAIEQDDDSTLWWYLAASLGAIGAVALGAYFVRRRRAALVVPNWTRSPARTGPQSFTDPSAAAVTLPNGSGAQRPSSSGRTPAPASLPRTTTIHDISTLDTLLNTTDADRVEERAVREAFAAARGEAERETDDNAVLRAIEEAERDLLFVPPAPAQAAIETSLDEDLIATPRRHDKAAA